MLHVTEVRDWCSARSPDGPACVAWFASRGEREQVIRRRRARSGSSVAIGTLPLKLQMQFMGKLLT
jgi:hypothetical protein